MITLPSKYYCAHFRDEDQYQDTVHFKTRHPGSILRSIRVHAHGRWCWWQNHWRQKKEVSKHWKEKAQNILRVVYRANIGQMQG